MNIVQRIVAKTFNLQGGSNPNGVPSSYGWQWWQNDLKPQDAQNNTSVEACVGTISQTVAMLPIKHYKLNEDGGTTVIKNSAATRVLRKPNSYQTRSDFLLNLSRNLLLTGNGYGVVDRNKRFEVSAIHIQNSMSPRITLDKRDVFYDTSGNGIDGILDTKTFVPARDVLHIKLHTPRHPLVGETPLMAALLSASIGSNIQAHEDKFFQNMSRPSGVLETDLTLDADQSRALRERFQERSQGSGSGDLPILSSGLKFKPLVMNAVDAQIVETYKMTIADIARVYRVPLTLVNALEQASYNNVEQLMKFWISSGLGFILDHMELSLNELFGLPSDEFLNFDTDYLLRSDFKSRLEGLSKAVQGGIYSPNEARKKEGLEPKENGDDIYFQAQMVRVGESTIDGTNVGVSNNNNDTINEDDIKTYLKGVIHG